MKILSPGQKVILHEGDPGEPSTKVEAEIVDAKIHRDLTVTYGCRWWDGSTMHEVSLTRLDFKPVELKLTTIELEKAEG
jgi:hypothetical protein